MKTRILLIFAVLLITACSKSDEFVPGDGFWIGVTALDKNGGSYDKVIDISDIEAYDFSSHLIYLKQNNPSISDIESGAFRVYVKDVKIYTGKFQPNSLSTLPEGVYINLPRFYPDYILELKWSAVTENVNDPMDDPRTDPRIIEALKARNQYREGLNCKILSIQFQENNKVEFSFNLTNNDTIDYYFLDPDKMKIGLFHYFTNGLVLMNLNDLKFYNPQITITMPDDKSEYLWEKPLLSVIKKGETKTYTVNYDAYDAMPSGKYRAYFTFPGLAHVEQKDLQQSGGKIWLGSVSVDMDIVK
jgi:hypothetical protein